MLLCSYQEKVPPQETFCLQSVMGYTVGVDETQSSDLCMKNTTKMMFAINWLKGTSKQVQRSNMTPNKH